MSGLARICKMYGGMIVVGNDGKKVEYSWDYAANEAVDSVQMPIGSERWKASERAKFGILTSPPRLSS